MDNEPKSGNLTLVEEAGGFRHYLDEEPIHAGEIVEYFDPIGRRWIAARYELAIGTRGRRGVLCVSDADVLTINATTRLRWPARY